MLKVYYSPKIENIYWKIYTENASKPVYYFSSDISSQDVVMKLNQINLFEVENVQKVNVIDITDWKLSSKQAQSDIKELNQCASDVILIVEANTVKSKLFDELSIKPTKIGNITRRNKNELVTYLLSKSGISLDYKTTEILLDLLPDNVQFILHEIEKLKLLNKKTFNADEIKKIVFDTGDATIFNVIDGWLSNDLQKTTHELNNLLSGNFDILEVIPMFAYKLCQVKFFLMAKKSRWSSDVMTNKLAIPFWLQNSYAKLKPYDEKLDKINDMISKLYNFDINIKKSNINKKESFAVPYAQLIKILFE